eukprot:TRINITY_DN3176_c0_g1_i2.p1 TRINITY_DN3176_c0_g1~~TRINITY_DN3176_c0_g1_i2.p1  ORF type:complete len:218 (-),score=52.93 TRINITY_DN3176_c0_g1_i2:63-716(-)
MCIRDRWYQRRVHGERILKTKPQNPMLPLLKVFSLVIRVFCRPLINYTKNYHKGGGVTSVRMRLFFIWLGNYHHRLEYRINRRFLKLSDNSDVYIKPLNEDIAIEKGVEFFYEILAYGLLLIIPGYEMYTGWVSDVAKTEKLEKRLKKMEEGVEGAQKTAEELYEQLNKRFGHLEEMLGNLKPEEGAVTLLDYVKSCLLYTSPSPRDRQKSRMPSSA